MAARRKGRNFTLCHAPESFLRRSSFCSDQIPSQRIQQWTTAANRRTSTWVYLLLRKIPIHHGSPYLYGTVSPVEAHSLGGRTYFNGGEVSTIPSGMLFVCIWTCIRKDLEEIRLSHHFWYPVTQSEHLDRMRYEFSRCGRLYTANAINVMHLSRETSD